MRAKIALGLAGVLGVLLLMNVVSAASFDFSSQISEFLDGIAKSMNPILQFTLGGGPDLTGELLVVKLLLFIIMLAILYKATDSVPGISEHPTVVWIIAIIISMLAARFMSSAALVNFVWLPTGVAGIALTCLLPFIIFFFFIESFESGIIRKVGWIFFTVLFFFLALTRWDNLATASPGFLANAGVQTFNLAWIYLITAVVSLVMIVGDRLIRDAIFRSRLKDTIGRKRRLEAIRVQEDIDELVRRLGAARNEESRKVLRTEISEKNKALAAILRGT